ncbi:MAG: hypothetical protein OXQ30_09645 [Boseongicola sp.]|nr:hypothetical protein [Boseongicola sp.]
MSTPVHVYYPNFGLRNADHSKAIILHHGHYFESLYLSMSRLGAAVSGGHSYPKTLEVMEKANGAFVDFIWSTVGDSGQMGSDVSLAYQYLLSGGAAAYFQRRIAALLTTTMLSKMPLPQVGPVRDTLQDINTGIVDYVAGSFGQLARFSYQTSLTYDTAGGIADYMNGPTVAQFKQEQMDEPPNDMSLIFGHTHKPFEDRLALDAYPNAVGVVNTGGWVLDTTLLATVEGASAVFIDDDLNVGVLKLFAPPANGETIPVSVSGFDGPGTENPMVDKLKSALAATQEQWDKVAEVAAETYTAKQTHIIKLLEAADAEARRKEALL